MSSFKSTILLIRGTTGFWRESRSSGGWTKHELNCLALAPCIYTVQHVKTPLSSYKSSLLPRPPPLGSYLSCASLHDHHFCPVSFPYFPAGHTLLLSVLCFLCTFQQVTPFSCLSLRLTVYHSTFYLLHTF